MLYPKVEAAIFLAKQGLPFRGHDDSGPLDMIESMKDYNSNEGKHIQVCFENVLGHFRGLVKFGALKSEKDHKFFVEGK